MFSDDVVEYKGYTIKFVQDHSPFDPRVDMDNLGHMICFHSRYNLGDKHTMTPEGLEEIIGSDGVLSLPCIIYDHSGLGMSTSRTYYPYNCPWDSSHVGYIYVTEDEIRKEYGDISAASQDKALKMLQAEVDTYNTYLQGDVWGWVVEKDDEVMESVWGYYGFEECVEEMLGEAQGIVDWELGKIEKERKEKEEQLEVLLHQRVVVSRQSGMCIVSSSGRLFKQPAGEYYLDTLGTVFLTEHVETVEDNIITLREDVK